MNVLIDCTEFVITADVTGEVRTKATMGHMESYACGEKQGLMLSLKQEASVD